MTLHRGHTFGLGALVAATIVGLMLLFVPSHRLARESRMPAVERLPEVARGALRTQMRGHARAMIELVSTVSVLDYDAVAGAVQRALDEPQIARPVTGDASELNGMLPARFFMLQAQLRDQLEALARAAAARNADATAEALGQSVRTCVGCHDAYLVGH